MTSLNTALFVNNHVVTEIIKAHFIVCAVSNIGSISLAACRIIFFMNNKPNGESEKVIKLAHPLAVTLGKVIVNRNDVNALACKGVKIRRESCHKSFAFTGFHFGDSALVKDDTADNLDGEVLHSENTPRRFADNCKGFR